MFLRSNLHDTFKHSVFKEEFHQMFGSDVLYSQEGDHRNVSTYAQKLHNLEARTLDKTFQLGLHIEAATEATEDTWAGLQSVRCRSHSIVSTMHSLWACCLLKCRALAHCIQCLDVIVGTSMQQRDVITQHQHTLHQNLWS